MSVQFFRVQEHTVPCQHIREYPGATAVAQEDILELAVKQYTPLDNLNPVSGDITIIGAHANGFPKVRRLCPIGGSLLLEVLSEDGFMLKDFKELYEPLWDELLGRSRKNGFRIRNIWIADVSHQGQSGVLNEGKQGDDPSWFDHARDLLHIINVFRMEMPRPLVGIGHSMGGCQLVMLSLMHPRLLTSLVLLDPVIQQFLLDPYGSHPVEPSTFRRDIWPSRKEAEVSFRNSRFYQKWDERVLQRWIQYGLRNLPTAVYDNPTGEAGNAVTLTTTRLQEVATFARPNYHDERVINRVTHADLDPDDVTIHPFYRPELSMTLKNLPHLRPSVLYVFGGKSPLSTPVLRDQKMKITGTGVGGSGGVKEGRVKEIVLEGVGHELAMEAAEGCADAVAHWLGMEISRWKAQEEEFQARWSKRNRRDMLVVSELWKQKLREKSRL